MPKALVDVMLSADNDTPEATLLRPSPSLGAPPNAEGGYTSASAAPVPPAFGHDLHGPRHPEAIRMVPVWDHPRPDRCPGTGRERSHEGLKARLKEMHDPSVHQELEKTEQSPPRS